MKIIERGLVRAIEGDLLRVDHLEQVKLGEGVRWGESGIGVVCRLKRTHALVARLRGELPRRRGAQATNASYDVK